MGNLAHVNPEPKLLPLLWREGKLRDALVVYDVGARGKVESQWARFKQEVAIIGFEPDEHECKRLNDKYRGTLFSFFPIALGGAKEPAVFYRTAHPPSSGVKRPNSAVTHRLPDEANLTIIAQSTLAVTDLDSFIAEHGIEHPDFIKIDTEGNELDILMGAEQTLAESTLGVSVEVSFQPVHHDQPLFSEIDQWLRGKKFRLYDLTAYRHAKKTLPEPSAAAIPGPTSRGQVLWGQALYFKDAYADLHAEERLGWWTLSRILKLASLYEIFEHQDSAVELLLKAGKHHLLSDAEARAYINVLMPKQFLSKSDPYKAYLQHIDRIKKRGYINLSGKLNQWVRFTKRTLPYRAKRLIPSSIRKIIRRWL